MKLRMITLGLPLLLTSVFFFASCENTEDDVTLITEEDAVEVLESSLINGSGGITNEIEEAAFVVEVYTDSRTGFNPYCANSFDSTLTADVNRPRITSSYEVTLSWLLECSDFSIPQTILFGREASGSYESNRFMGNSQSSGDWRIGNLVSETYWVYNGAFERIGSHGSMVRNQKSLDVKLQTTFTNIEVEKASHTIQSGEGAFTLSLEGSAGNTANYQGLISYQGDGFVVITLNDNTYEIELD